MNNGLALLWLEALPVLLGLFALVWAFSVLIRNASIVDPLWGPAYAVLTLVILARTPDPGVRTWVTVGAVLLWAGRLGVYLAFRAAGKPEDYRYAAMRAGHGRRFWWVSLFTVFWFQGLLVWILGWPLVGAVHTPGGLGAWGVAGVVVFAAGWLMETVADAHLQRFKADPANKGRVLDRGLWRYSRHPNYFGEAVLWWGFYLLAVDAGFAWTVFAPLAMTFLLMKVSGVPLLEPHLEATRPGYAEYVRTTSSFLPLPPRPGD